MTRTTVWISGDQCTPRNSAFAGVDRANARVLMIESLAWGRERPYHKRKLVLIYAAMRGFAHDLRRDGWDVDYYAERDDLETPLAEHVASFAPTEARMMGQSDYGDTERMRGALAALGVPLAVSEHTNFVSSAGDFAALFARGQTRVTMETFYRAMRKKTRLLMDGDEPVGVPGISIAIIAGRRFGECAFRPRSSCRCTTLRARDSLINRLGGG